MTRNGDTGKSAPLEYAPASRHTGRIRFIIAGISLAAVMLLVIDPISLIFPAMGRSRETANRVKCGSNLRLIGQAISHYANAHDGVLPDSFEAMIVTEELGAATLICPTSDDVPATGNTLQDVAQNLTAKPGRLSYIYVGKGHRMPIAADTIMAYEPLSNHSNDGSYVVFGDGHVDFLIRTQVRAFLAELQSGHNPPRPEMLTPNPATTPAVAP